MSFDTTAIRIDGLSKCYQVYEHPRDRLKQFILPRVRRAVALPARDYFRKFWALRDFSLEVRRGETIGIIGRNGSGKSTLLQLICGTLSPSSGIVEVNGRVSALLELGAGFNPEFTGRENVLLSAAILGFDTGHFDEQYAHIVVFADIGEFIDQPVKTYSSGMLVRLAFAVAIHVAPSVLIVDEALSVGDMAFQNKCVQRLRQLRDEGVTLIFVSHDLNTIQMICDRVIWIDRGAAVSIGKAVEVCQEYQVAMIGNSAEIAPATAVISQQKTGMAAFTELSLAEFVEGDVPFELGGSIRFRFTLRAEVDLPQDIVFAVSVYRADGDWLIGQTSREEGVFWPALPAAKSTSGVYVMQPLCLVPGEYLAAFAAYSADLSLCYALSDLNIRFSVRAKHPTWGRFAHPSQWLVG